MATILQALTFNLASPIDATQTSIAVRNLKDSRGNPIIAMIGTLLFATIEPRSNSNQEIISFTGITNNGNGIVTLTGVTRNLDPRPPYATLGGLVPHSNNAECILSNNPPFYNDFLQVTSNVTITGDYRFPTPTNPDNAATKAYADSLALAGAPDASITAKGVARLTTTSEVVLGNPTITIASPAVVTLAAHGLTVDDTVKFSTTIALPTGIVAGNTYYVISAGLTADDFRVSLTQGGVAVDTSGSQSGVHTLTRTTPRAVSDTDPRLVSIPPTDIQTFTANGTWTKPAGAKAVTVIVIGAGGGGGGGRSDSGATVTKGGAAGGGGARKEITFPAALTSATEAIVVGVGGAGGAATVAGTDGGNSSFGSLVTAYGGIGGAGGTTAVGIVNGGGGGGTSSKGTGTTGGDPKGGTDAARDTNGGGGGAGSNSTVVAGGDTEYGGGGGGSGTGGNANSPGAGGSSVSGGGGGGGGGGMDGTSFPRDGAAGGSSNTYVSGGGGAGGVGTSGAGQGGSGTAGTSRTNGFCGDGGGGGGAGRAGGGGNGGNGGTPAGGGGGGGGCNNSGVGGTGGTGARGEVIVITYF